MRRTNAETVRQAAVRAKAMEARGKIQADPDDADLTEFTLRYTAILRCASGYVKRWVGLGRGRYIRTRDVAEWISYDLPELYAVTFGRGDPKPLRVYRVMRMLGDANYLGAYEAFGIRAVHGRGITVVDAPKKLRSVK